MRTQRVSNSRLALLRAPCLSPRLVRLQHGAPLLPPANLAFMFPGQGAQFVGMGRDLASDFPEARAAFDEVDSALGEPLSKTLFEGPLATLSRTVNTQPALLAHSIAALRAALAAGLPCDGAACVAVLGHSVGEYAALVAAGALELGDAARLLRARGLLMEGAIAAASPSVSLPEDDKGMEHGMVAILLRPLSGALEDPTVALDAACAAALRACADAVSAGNSGASASIAAVNSPRQIVLSGTAGAISAAADSLIRSRVAARSVRLAVSVPFHSALLRPAGEALAVLFAGAADSQLSPTAELLLARVGLGTSAGPWPVRLRAPTIPFVSNVSSLPETDPARIARLLCDGVSLPVRWHDCVRSSVLQLGARQFVEFGAGATLCGLIEQSAKAGSLPGGGVFVRHVSASAEVGQLQGASQPLAATKTGSTTTNSVLH